MIQKSNILDSEGMGRALGRIAYEIIERNHGVEDVVIIGIQRRGVPLARRIAQKINEVENVNIPVGVLDITFYRDDLSYLAKHPIIKGTDINFPITGKTVILVDDVLFTGRTIRAAIDAIMDIGRPKAIQLAVLVDRGHRELPICADYVGKNLPTSMAETVEVSVDDVDGENKVTINKEV